MMYRVADEQLVPGGISQLDSLASSGNKAEQPYTPQDPKTTGVVHGTEWISAGRSTWSDVHEGAGMGAMGMDRRWGAMALRMMDRSMPAASS